MRLRQAVRALILDPDDRVLLVHFDLRPRGEEEFWACPGGGLEPGEDAHAALRRELRSVPGVHIRQFVERQTAHERRGGRKNVGVDRRLSERRSTGKGTLIYSVDSAAGESSVLAR